jgi:NAD(P)-dependent dehydrogenase (short-subunit alcohol dehydrogenase family)
MTRRVHDQAVVVTGASNGIGRATSRLFAEAGATVFAAARDADALESLAGEAGGRVVPVPTDVTDPAAVRALAETAVQHAGRVDTWVNAAATHEYAWFEDTTPEEFAEVLTTNVLGQVHGAYAAVPVLAANDTGGVLIGVSSVEGVRAVPLQAPYVTSKWALRGFYDTLRMEMALRHPDVKVTTILPASIDTPIFEHARTKLERLPKPPPPLYAPEVVARAILHASEHPQRELPVGGSAAQFMVGQRFAPSLMDWLLSRRFAAVKAQQTDLPNPPSDNLGGPVPGGSERGAVQQSVSSVKERSLFTELVWQRPAVKRGLIGAALAAIGWAVAR